MTPLTSGQEPPRGVLSQAQGAPVTYYPGRDTLCTALVGRAQKLVGEVGEAVQRRDLGLLAATAVEPGSRRWEALTSLAGRIRWHDASARDPLDPETDRDIPPWCSAANALTTLGRAIIACDGDTNEEIPTVLSAVSAHFERACCVGVGTSDAVSSTEGSSPVLNNLVTSLREAVPGPAAGFVALLAAHLLGELKAPLRGVTVPVLVDRNRTGAAVELRVELRAAGPPGLHPDPAFMPFLVTDQALVDAARTAWALSPFSASGACVTWRMVEKGDPCNDVQQASSSVAMAIALDELYRRRFRFLPRLRTLDGRSATSGRLKSDKTIGAVQSYPNKIAAAVDAGYNLVLPKASRGDRGISDAQEGADGERVTIRYVDDLNEAIKATRSRWDLKVALSLAIVAVLVLVGGTAWGVATVQQRDQTDAANRASLSSNLAARATTLRQTNPRLAALLGLEAHELDPTNGRAVDAMRDVISDNAGISRSWQASRSSVMGIAVDDPAGRVYTSGEEDTVRAWDVATGALKGETPGRAERMALNPAVPILATEAGGTVALLETTAAAPKQLGTLPAAPCVQANASVRNLGFTTGGVELLVSWSSGDFATYDVTSRALLRCVRLADIAAGQVDGRFTPGLVLDAAVVTGTPNDQLVLLLNTNRVLTVGLAADSVTSELTQNDIPGNASSIAASDSTIAVGTAGGVMFWDRQRKTRLAYPAGGVVTPPTAISASKYRFAFAGPGGTVQLAGDSRDNGIGLARPTGGTSTAVAQGDNTIVAGEAGGRVSVLTDNAPITPAKPSTAITFTGDHSLMSARIDGIANAYGLYVDDLTRPADVSQQDGSTDYPHLANYNLDGPVRITAIANADGMTAAATATSSGGAVLLWNADKTLMRPMYLPTSDSTRPKRERVMVQVAFVPSEQLVVGRHVSGQVGIWSSRSGDLVGTIDLPPGATAMAVHGSNGVFAVGSGADQYLVTIDLADRHEIARISLRGVQGLSWTSDGSQVLAITDDNRIVALPADLSSPGRDWTLPAGDSPAFIAANPARPEVAVAQGPRVHIYDIGSGVEAVPALEEPLGNQVADLAWSPDGTTLAGLTFEKRGETVSMKQTDLWQLDDLDWRAQICRTAGTSLTPDEWNSYIGASTPYTDRCA